MDSGYGKMADVWFASLEDILPQYTKPGGMIIIIPVVGHGVLSVLSATNECWNDCLMFPILLI